MLGINLLWFGIQISSFKIFSMKRLSQIYILTTMIYSCNFAEKNSMPNNRPNLEGFYEDGDKHYYKNEFDSAIYFYKKNLVQFYSENLPSYLLNDIGLCYKKMGFYDSALYYYSKAESIDLKNNDSSLLIRRWLNIGTVYKQKGDYAHSSKYLLLALDGAGRLNDKRIMASSNNSLGSIALDQQQVEKAISFFNNAFAYYNKDNPNKAALILNNIGVTYDLIDEYDSALKYWNLSKKLKAVRDSTNLPSTLHNLGSIYFKLGNQDSSLFYLRKAYQMRENHGDQRGIASTSHELTKYYMDSHPSKSKAYLDQAYKYAIKQKNNTLLQENHQLMAEYYKVVGQHELAYSYLEKWSAMRDSVFNQERLKTLELQSEYDLEESQKETTLAEKQTQLMLQKSNQNLLLASILGLLLIAISASAFLFYRQRRKLKLLNGSLDEKNRLISTLSQQHFHFTKNSLAGVVSMLNLQTRKMEDGDVKNTLIAEKLRMETINLLYHQLFSSPETNSVDLKPFLEGIVHNTVESILGDQMNQISLAMESFAIENEKALSIGMIVNEICLNACKYALNEDMRFEISLTHQNEVLHLKLKDTGGGFPDEFSWETSTSFGIRLIKLLSKELDAEMEVDSSTKGVFYYLRIPTHLRL